VSQPTLDCPYCGGTLSLKPSRYGRFYGCSGYPACDATVGAHPDGSPLGTPANQPLKDARIAAHASFDRLWKGGGSRGRAYRFLQSALNLSEDACHIGMFDLAMCARVVEVCDRELGRRSGIRAKPARRKRVRR
jgi:ssDNA-binding Zn-finger/Zn-ribbon topoisomerase 1